MANSVPNVFSSENIKVFAQDTDRPDVLLTFTHWNRRGPLWAGLAAAAGMAFVSVVARQNHWWQTENFPQAMDAVRALVGSSSRITAFGTSMGGAGAIFSAQFLELSKVLAVAPPIIVDQDHAPWETRFQRVRHLTKIRFPLGPNLAPNTQTFIIYDPFFSDDVKHLALLDRAGRSFYRWPMPLSGHTPMIELQKTGLYRDFTTAFFVKDDVQEAWSILRKARKVRGMMQLANAQRREFRGSRYIEPAFIGRLSNLIDEFGPQIEMLDERGKAHMAQGLFARAVEDYDRCYAIETRKKYERKLDHARRLVNR